MKKIDNVLRCIKELQQKKNKGVSALELSKYMELDRANVSRYLNDLYKEGLITKSKGRPVIYSLCYGTNIEENIKLNIKEKKSENIIKKNSLDSLIGSSQSLKTSIQQAKAAILYPPMGLNTIILGETGVGKSMFAECMYNFAKESKVIDSNAPFVRFNCADYSDNPQLLISQVFGVKKGAFTGADKDRDGLLKVADGGVLFLDEIHRLPPQGQEMLFTFIDKGCFRPLGESEKLVTSKVRIIAATTEEPRSYLLKTFTRRIPMMINLPSLKDRDIEERYNLLEMFAKEESRRIGEDIYFEKNSLISFLLYDCTSNIGQLKSDIQLSCAKAFLDYKANNRKLMIVKQDNLQQTVRNGIMKIKDYRLEIEDLFKGLDNTICFSHKDSDNSLVYEDVSNDNKNNRFYSYIEHKFNDLRKEGLEDVEINNILNLDIESYFKRYIDDINNVLRKEEIAKIVSTKIIDIVEKILDYSSKKLNRKFDEKVYLGLAFHLQESIERLSKGRKIYNPKLESIRSNNKEEFIVAMEISKFIEDEFLISVPLDEIGYITMFLANKKNVDKNKIDKRVGVLVIMHGKSTASSMVEVANTLIGEEYVHALDMPLDMKVETMFISVKRKIQEIDNGNGVIILADMGSLINFGDLIKDEMKINIKTIDKVTTISVIEAGRKALNGRDLKQIYRSCVEINSNKNKDSYSDEFKKELAIVTTCFTGEGSAKKIKKFIEENTLEKIKVIAMNILDMDDFFKRINNVKSNYKLVAIVGTFKVKVKGITFLPVTELFSQNGMNKLNFLINNEMDYLNICKSLDEGIGNFNSYELVDDIREFIENIESDLNIVMDHEIRVGILIHVYSLIHKLTLGEKRKQFPCLDKLKESKETYFSILRSRVKLLEVNYLVDITDNDLAYIIKIIISNT